MKTASAFLKLVRGFHLFFLALGLSLFYYLLLIPAHRHKLFTTLLPFTDFEFGLFVLSVVFAAAAGSIINDYYEFDQDKKYKPHRPLAQGVFSLDTAMYLHAAFAFAGIGLGFYLGYKAGSFKIGYLYVICVVLLYLYSSYLKKIPLAGNVIVAALAGFVFLLLLLFEVTFLKTISFEGANYVLDLLLWQVKFYGGGIFLLTVACMLVTDLENKQADEDYGINTLPVQFGETITKAVVILILGVLLAGVGFILRGFIEAGALKELAYFVMVVVIPVVAVVVLLFSAREQKQYARISSLLKVIMFLGILSIPAFYLFNK